MNELVALPVNELLDLEAARAEAEQSRRALAIFDQARRELEESRRRLAGDTPVTGERQRVRAAVKAKRRAQGKAAKRARRKARAR